MSIFERLNGQPQMTMQQLRQDPVGMAKQAGYDIPQELAGNAQAMVQHLFQTEAGKSRGNGSVHGIRSLWNGTKNQTHHP